MPSSSKAESLNFLMNKGRWATHLRTQFPLICAHKSGSSVHTHIRVGIGMGGVGGVKTTFK